MLNQCTEAMEQYVKFIPLVFPGSDYFLRDLYSTWHVPYFGEDGLRILLTFCELDSCLTFAKSKASSISNDICLILPYVILVADSKLPRE